MIVHGCQTHSNRDILEIGKHGSSHHTDLLCQFYQFCFDQFVNWNGMFGQFITNINIIIIINCITVYDNNNNYSTLKTLT